MNEGSFDQREAIFAPTPATLAFRLDLPRGARLRFSPAVAVPLPATTVFSVTLVDARGRNTPSASRTFRLEATAVGERRGQPRALGRAESAAPAAHGDHARDACIDRKSCPELPRRRQRGAESAAAPPPMALALWGDPVIVAKEPTRVPYNVLWIVVDALRPDAVASLHDPDEDARSSPRPSPARGAAAGGPRAHASDRRARAARACASPTRGPPRRGRARARSRCSRASARASSGSTRRTGCSPSTGVARYYASEPPLLPLLLRRNGVTTAAFVNNFFMAGYATVGLDMGFERVTDHRYRTRDTALDHAGRARLARGERRHPLLPLRELQLAARAVRAAQRDARARPAAAPGAARRRGARLHGGGGEGRRGHRRAPRQARRPRASRSTLVVVTSDHGETLSSAHDGFGMKAATRCRCASTTRSATSRRRRGSRS